VGWFKMVRMAYTWDARLPELSWDDEGTTSWSGFSSEVDSALATNVSSVSEEVAGEIGGLSVVVGTAMVTTRHTAVNGPISKRQPTTCTMQHDLRSKIQLLQNGI
jgi:hypothetical protein